MLMIDSIYDFIRPPTVHALGCPCSVCWAHNFADALQLMPYTEAERTQYTNYLTFYDYTKQFIIENQHTDRADLDG